MSKQDRLALLGGADHRDILREDEKYYLLSEQELAFYNSQTGINGEEELKQHIINVQVEAFEVFPYTCIRRFSFTKLKISRMPKYEYLLKLGRERKDAILLDIGCCFGNDARKAVADGYYMANVVASDLQPEFWQLGHKLFNSTPETFAVPFLPGDAFDPAFLKPSPPIYSVPQTPAPELSSFDLTYILGRTCVRRPRIVLFPPL